jgi:hypothetical protein
MLHRCANATASWHLLPLLCIDYLAQQQQQGAEQHNDGGGSLNDTCATPSKSRKRTKAVANERKGRRQKLGAAADSDRDSDSDRNRDSSADADGKGAKVDGNEVLKAVADELGIDKCSASAVLRAVGLQKAAAHSAIDDRNTLRSETSKEKAAAAALSCKLGTDILHQWTDADFNSSAAAVGSKSCSAAAVLEAADVQRDQLATTKDEITTRTQRVDDLGSAVCTFVLDLGNTLGVEVSLHLH